MLLASLACFCLGNYLMVRVMRENGLGMALALSLVFQLVAVTVIAFFGFWQTPERIAIGGGGAWNCVHLNDFMATGGAS